MNQPRWFLYGMVDGAIVGGVMGGAVTMPMATNEWNGHAEMELLGLLLGYFAPGAVYGGLIGFVVGLLGGMAIDLLRQFGLDDRPAVALTMVPVLCGVLVVAGTHRADGGIWLTVPVAAVVVDLCWRLSRLDRRTPTVLT